MEKFLEYLDEAEKIIKTVDHMVYVTFPLLRAKNILLKVISEIKRAITSCINSILYYEYINKKIKLYKRHETNFRIFSESCALRYRITKEEIKLILELFNLVEKSKQSSMEFIKDEKIVILSENMKTEVISMEKIKIFLNLAKNLLEKIKNKI